MIAQFLIELVDGIEVGALGGPFEDVDLAVARAVCLGSLSCWKRHRQLIGRLGEVGVQDADIMLGVHPRVDEFEAALSGRRHAAPEHDIATTELDRSSEAAELERFTGHVDRAEFGFVRPQKSIGL